MGDFMGTSDIFLNVFEIGQHKERISAQMQLTE